MDGIVVQHISHLEATRLSEAVLNLVKCYDESLPMFQPYAWPVHLYGRCISVTYCRGQSGQIWWMHNVSGKVDQINFAPL